MQHHMSFPIQINPKASVVNQIPKHSKIPLLPHHERKPHGRIEIFRHREALFTAIVRQRRSPNGLKQRLLAGAELQPGIVENHANFGKDVVRPPVASFTPSTWGDTFTSLISSDDEAQLINYAESIEALKQEARSMLMAEGKKRFEKLVLIDIVERLGIGYHFQQEIEDQLQQIFAQYSNSTNDDHEEDDDDLFITSLQFRLLRQHRYYVPCSVFDKFIKVEGEGKFKESLHDDAKGLLSLYEAAHLQTQGEEILEEAVAFTTHHLKRLLLEEKLDPSSSLQHQVKRALEQPLHRGVERIETRYYISSNDNDHEDTRINETLLKFAKLDFNYVQNMYKKELHQVSRWWNELDLISKLPYSRDRIVEACVWGTVFRFEPQYSNVRMAVSKAIQMIAIIDDMYDNYATVEEAELFTEAMERWDMNEIHGLPNEEMKTVYRFVLNEYEEYEREAAKQGKLFAVPYAKEAVKQLCRAYNQGLKWFTGLQVPTFEEYLVNSVVTGTIYAFGTSAFPFMKQYASSESIDWLISEPKILSATALQGRYWNDSGSHERESKDGQMLTGVDFYMRQYGLSKKETMDKFEELGEEEWKKVNAAWMTKKSGISCDRQEDMAYEVLNMARAVEITYKNCKDGFSSPEAKYKALMKDLFVDPIPT